MINPITEKSKEKKSPLSDNNTAISGERIHGYVGVFGNITIDSTITPDSPRTFPVYRGVLKEGDSFEKFFQTIGKIRQNVTSVTDADRVARMAMEPYGGIPPDAVYQGAETTYGELYNYSSKIVESRWPESTSVSYTCFINNRWINGDNNWIRLELGENGELLYVIKVWRTYTYIGDVPVIPLDKAIRKLQNGETMETYLEEKQDVTITVMGLEYYAKTVANNETVLEPIWSFNGRTSRGDPIVFDVYARQFASFTASPINGNVPLTVAFTDTSDTSPSEWYWNFGDGTNSTDQNPSHTYSSAGTYNVSLRVWNDLGSDTMEKPDLITARNPAPPVANFTGTPASGSAPLSVTFNDTSANTPTGWFWSFGDGTNATVQNPAHTYTVPGNYSVSLNVTNDDGTDDITRSGYITVTSLPPTTLTTQPTTTTATTVTTIPATTRPTPTGTRTPLSTVPVIAALNLAGLLVLVWRRNRS
jgi:PKD repeat protein